MNKPVILTGLRANNDLHIGNYLGALLPMVDMARTKSGEYQVNLFVPDLHSFTTPIDHDSLQVAIAQNLRVFAAAGLPLDNSDVHLYRQSYVPAHSELTVILNSFTGFGEMRRMTQFKEKVRTMRDDFLDVFEKYGNVGGMTAEQAKKTDALVDPIKEGSASVGLFDYPVLMAADILLYGATYVPVGDDQTQHLEFTRDIAERMNKKFATDLFVIPKPGREQHEFFGKDQGLRIKDLADPTKKMSKSDDTGKGVIFMTDTPEVARRKIMSATTDSVGKINYDRDNQAGIVNLLDLLALFGGREIVDIKQEYEGQDQYGPLKTAVADAVAEFLTKFQADLARVDEQAIQAKLVESEKQMNQQANATLLKVQQAVGLRS
ncbi:MAG: tryptophan--tRNA ligase [Patescibacteria group bacterium]